MPLVTTPRATLDDLYRVEGKAELLGGRIVRYPASGHLPAVAAGEVAVSLHLHARSTGRGMAHLGALVYAVPELPSGRESFSPDASYFTGQRPANPMRFIDGPPDFAAEVRSENDYGPAAEAEMAAKRDDYFAAGTTVVWDVDPVARTVAVYRADAPRRPVVLRPGYTADAEPAVPGWRMAVGEVFAG